MNLHKEPIGAVFFTSDGLFRARLEKTNGEQFALALFNKQGELAMVKNYYYDGVPSNTSYPEASNRHDLNWLGQNLIKLDNNEDKQNEL